MMWKGLLTGLTFLVVTAGNLFSQTPRPTAPGTPAPPTARLDPRRIAPYHQSFRMVMVKDGQEEEIGTLDDRVLIEDDGGTPAIIRIQNVDGPTGTMMDSSIADAATLTPRRHNSQSERRILLLQFAGRHLTGTYWEAGDPSFPVDEQIPDSTFDSNMLDVLLAAMPLGPGYTGRLMVYLYEVGGATAMDVAVTGSGKVDGVDTWVTNVTLRGRTARYDVGKADHRVAQIVSSAGPGAEIHLKRNPPLTR